MARWMMMAALLAGCPQGGETDTETDGHTDPPVEVDAVLGAGCDLAERVALVTVQRWGSEGNASFSAQVFDRPNPWYGPPSLSNDHCDFHTFNVGSCGNCPSGEVCGLDGDCVPQPRAVTNIELSVDDDGEVSTHVPNDQGFLYGDVSDGPVGMVLTTPTHVVSLAPTSVPSGDLVPTVRSDGDYDTPGALTFSWTKPADGGAIGTLIPINHHAAGPTFTTCLADADDDGFVADAEMVNPLAVSTGLEYQGLDHLRIAAADLGDTCVEFRFETRVYSDVQFPR